MNRRVLISGTLYCLTLAGALLMALALLRWGAHEAAVVGLVTFVGLAVLLIVQRLHPFREDWRGWRSELGVDVVHGLLSNIATTVAVQAALVSTVFVFADHLALWAGLSIWPSDWSVGLQVALALVLGDLGAYWVHRLAHRVPLFWRVHQVHHSSSMLYLLSSARNHPLNVAATYAATLVPLALLGARGEVLVLTGVFTGVHGMLQHANIDWRLGPLNWVFAGPELHRLHHSVDLAESNTNFGSNIIVWDVIFGTRRLTALGAAHVGVPEFELPTNWFAHLAAPFKRRRAARLAAFTHVVRLDSLPRDGVNLHRQREVGESGDQKSH